MTIRVGDAAAYEFTIDEAAMRWIQSLSKDMSRIHADADFARKRGFKGVIAYGGIMLAHLSYVLGTHLPGRNGTSTKWTINYREPLYLDEPARLVLEITHVSKATGIVESKFRISSEDRTIATGTTQSMVPTEEVEEG